MPAVIAGLLVGVMMSSIVIGSIYALVSAWVDFDASQLWWVGATERSPPVGVLMAHGVYGLVVGLVVGLVYGWLT